MRKKGSTEKTPKDNVYFWMLFTVIALVCFGGFTYLFSSFSTPAGSEIISPR